MASAMRKMAVYLGLVEDDHGYEDPYTDEYGDGEDYGDYITEYAPTASQGDARDAHPGALMISAGMTGDLEYAIAEGATHVRVGTALLGGRRAFVR